MRRQPLSWSQSLFGYYTGFRNAVEAFGLLVLVPFIKRVVHVEDTVLLAASLITNGLAMIVIGCSTISPLIFIG